MIETLFFYAAIAAASAGFIAALALIGFLLASWIHGSSFERIMRGDK